MSNLFALVHMCPNYEVWALLLPPLSVEARALSNGTVKVASSQVPMLQSPDSR
jgi:hypothetical protein